MGSGDHTTEYDHASAQAAGMPQSKQSQVRLVTCRITWNRDGHDSARTKVVPLVPVAG